MSEVKQKVIYLADCQSFYASVEKATHPEYRNRPLVVAGDPERRSGIILAACPIAKSFGVTTAERLGEAIKKCPDLVIIRPRMQHYINVSLAITRIYESYTDLVEPYSIDEQFLDVTGSLKFFDVDPETLAQKIRVRIMEELRINVRVGISNCKVLAKTACDNFAKKNETGIFSLYKGDLEYTLWKLTIDKMFMVGSKMTRHLIRMGILTIGDLAKTPLPQLKQKFRACFGKQSDVHAELLWRTANGIDDSPVSPNTFNTAPKSVGHMMTLPRDCFNSSEIDTILLELTEEVCRDCRRKGYMASVVSVSCMCSPYEAPTGFSRQMKLPDPGNHTNTVYEVAKALFYQYWDKMPVRRIGVILSGLVDDQGYQLTLFEDQVKNRELDKVTDTIKDRYGSTAIIRASSLTSAGQARDRSIKIGGHYK